MERSIFLDVVGYSPIMKIIEHLIGGREFDYCLTDIAEGANVSWTTLHKIFPELIKNKFVVQTRTIGRAKLYKLNKENPIVKKLIEIDNMLIMQELKKKSSVKLTH